MFLQCLTVEYDSYELLSIMITLISFSYILLDYHSYQNSSLNKRNKNAEISKKVDKRDFSLIEKMNT